MKDAWYFEIGDGQVYGPYPMAKLQKWAEAGNLMPTHRVRHADSDEWMIAAYVDGLELTTAADAKKKAALDDDAAPSELLRGRGAWGVGQGGGEKSSGGGTDGFGEALSRLACAPSYE